MKRLLCFVVVLLTFVMAVVPVAADDSAVLLLADSAGVVHVFDVALGTIVDTMTFEEAPRLYTSPSGDYVFAILRNGNQIRAIDLRGEAPMLTDFALNVQRPTHFDMYGDIIAAFNDGDGTVTLFTEAILDNNGVATTYFTGQAHHGVAVVVDDVVIATNPMPEANLPIGAAVYALDGTLLAAFDNCPGLHGKAVLNDGRVAFGCDDGVAIVSGAGSDWTTEKISEDSERRIGNFSYSDAAGLLVGNWGGNAYALVDSAAMTITAVELPAPLWLSPPSFLDDETVVVLTNDGSLHRVVAATGEVLATAANAISGFVAPSEGQTAPRPAMMHADGIAYLFDPYAMTLVAVDLSDMTVMTTVELGVMISSMVAIS